MAVANMMTYPVRETIPSYPPQYSMYPTRAHQPHGATISTNPYASFAPSSQQHHLPQPQTHLPSQPQPQPQLQLQQPSSRSSGSPDSSEDGNRPSLPSISNLLGIADGDRPNDGHASQQAQQRAAQLAQQQQQQQHAIMAEQRHRHAYPAVDLSSSQRTVIPPTPPLRNDSVIDSTQSPSTISTGSSLSAQPYFLGSALNNMDAEQQRVAHVHLMKRHSLPSQPNTSPYGHPSYTSSPYGSSPGGVSTGSYYSPSEHSYPVSNLCHTQHAHQQQQQQRTLPSNFPPQPPLPVQQQSTTPHALPAPNPWEHHHYISPSSQATFPQSQDRYICQTCNKAFSRPSSLKIHSHSHTGEKPFKCPHAGCGKAFSVRSNMKRHERGCHTGGGGGGSGGPVGETAFV